MASPWAKAKAKYSPSSSGVSPGAMGGKTGSGVGGPKYQGSKKSSSSFTPADATYDAGKLAYAAFLRDRQGQGGGGSSQARKQYYNQLGAGPAPLQDIQNITQRYSRAADIPGYQAKMKDYQAFQQAQADDGIARFTQGPLKGQQILSMREPQLTAMAPTFKQLMGDVGGAFSSMTQGLAEKGTPMMNLAKSFFGGIQDFFTPKNLQTGFNNFMQSGQNFNTMLLGLPQYQRRVYDMEIMKPGMTREEAYRTAIRTPKMAYGGIATLS